MLLAELDAAALRTQARHLERNHDLARGALDVLQRNIVGAHGIGVEPMPRKKDGTSHEVFADALARLWADWTRQPEISGRLSWAQCQHLVCRSWLRDGEGLAQMMPGRVAGLVHASAVPLTLQLLEADHLPLDYHEDGARTIRSGIEVSSVGRVSAYHLYKTHPGDSGAFYLRATNELARVTADRMIHLALADRIGQLRGVSLFSSVITRLEDLKDFEESERIAAKISASMAAFIRKGTPEQYGNVGGDSDADGDAKTGRASFSMQPGMVFTDLMPGEDIGTVQSNRPNPQLEVYRGGQLRAAAAGLNTSYSSLSRDYNGTYSAQRQELVEQWTGYALLTKQFIDRFPRPVYRAFLDLAIASGALKIPADLDLATLYDAEFRGPVMPWVDPLKEVEAVKRQIRGGLKSRTQAIRERGGNPWETQEQIADERKEDTRLGLVFDTDASQTSASGIAQPTDDAEPGDEAQPPLRQAARLNGDTH